MKLKDKVILVTGASQGLGYAIAQGCALEGAIIIMAARREDILIQAKNSLVLKDLRCEAIRLDVTCCEDVNNAIDGIVAKYGHIDGLVNNAGMTQRIKFLDSTINDYNVCIDSNLKSTYMCCRKAAEYMVRQGSGSIVNVASVAAHNGGGLMSTSLYCAAKGGIISFTKGIARELAPFGVRVNTLAPGCIDTPATTIDRDPEEYQMSIKKIPLHRRGQPIDVVAPVVLLLSDESAFMTGSTVDVNGGVYMA